MSQLRRAERFRLRTSASKSPQADRAARGVRADDLRLLRWTNLAWAGVALGPLRRLLPGLARARQLQLRDLEANVAALARVVVPIGRGSQPPSSGDPAPYRATGFRDYQPGICSPGALPRCLQAIDCERSIPGSVPSPRLIGHDWVYSGSSPRTSSPVATASSVVAAPGWSRADYRPAQPVQALAHANVDLLAEEVTLLASHATKEARRFMPSTVGTGSRAVQDTIRSTE